MAVRVKDIGDRLQTFIDPFDLDVFMPHILSNLEKQLQRSTVIHFPSLSSPLPLSSLPPSLFPPSSLMVNPANTQCTWLICYSTVVLGSTERVIHTWPSLNKNPKQSSHGSILNQLLATVFRLPVEGTLSCSSPATGHKEQSMRRLRDCTKHMSTFTVVSVVLYPSRCYWECCMPSGVLLALRPSINQLQAQRRRNTL